ncbi:cAMP-specific 3',5'-cyclic phosphodiesterase 7B [Gaeumannomyces tritici R3-111a-1]|uniref:Phosphodiesterase n=1 Tax=Gaeumannomyces tritici (strain R3-111a-1) TaxID=644352 RepID=J3NJC6_GAET3|nr:cAMP-specific 3',5'-cyclic phosphodiesterase 7B [Gaeumannomyces tritici R3-111a-1]EJT81377.1 cAMP-specific 3',5'-cyclic phosphodiesterase 7B [Gaeumannomyces tritici R3-111a-1]
MDDVSCDLIYVDRSVREDRVIRAPSRGSGSFGSFQDAASGCETQTLRENVALLLEAIGDETTPTVVLIDIPSNERLPVDDRSRPTSPHSNPSSEERPPDSADGDGYGIRLLQMIVSEAHLRNMSSLVVPIPLISFPGAERAGATANGSDMPGISTLEGGRLVPDRRLLKGCLDLGATDVLVNPVNSVTSIQTHAYRAHKEALKERQAILEVKRGRKRSWVGVDEQKPFAYLREAMVSGLMSGICRPGDDQDDRVSNIRIRVPPERHQLITYLIACRAAYNSFVPYHNFRHVIDVLQATFHFLVQIGALPPFPLPDYQDGVLPTQESPTSPMAGLLEPFEALTLLVTAVGHDVGHPGVNNGFLVTLNAPLAQLYNDRSVLESFHCAAYSQILRRHWPAAFEDLRMRKLMISSILATDMGLHFDYMKKLGDLQEKLQASNTTEGWNGRMIEEQKALLCALLIKCADISNVARKHDTALQWTHILSDEFSRQASMESELEIPSSLMSPPKKDVLSLSKAQLGFLNLFAIPLFQGVADILPQTRYCVDELEINKALFQKMVEEEVAKQLNRPRLIHDGTMSPRTMSIAVTPDTDRDLRTPSAISGGVSPTETSVPFSMTEERPTKVSYKPLDVSALPNKYQEVNGITTSFDAVADFAASDPFGMHDTRPPTSRKQRCSEATEGSASAPGAGDWASQANSATTGKMPLSPSTQGTSIISQESLDRPSSVPVPTVEVPEYDHEPLGSHPPESRLDKNHSDSRLGTSPSSMYAEEDSSTSTNAKLSEARTLKKKPSRFRMNAFPFFRRHRGASPPIPAADTAGWRRRKYATSSFHFPRFYKALHPRAATGHSHHGLQYTTLVSLDGNGDRWCLRRMGTRYDKGRKGPRTNVLIRKPWYCLYSSPRGMFHLSVRVSTTKGGGGSRSLMAA